MHRLRRAAYNTDGATPDGSLSHHPLMTSRASSDCERTNFAGCRDWWPMINTGIDTWQCLQQPRAGVEACACWLKSSFSYHQMALLGSCLSRSKHR